MITSMTGFGKSETQVLNKKMTVEIRTLNSKNIDLKNLNKNYFSIQLFTVVNKYYCHIIIFKIFINLQHCSLMLSIYPQPEI